MKMLGEHERERRTDDVVLWSKRRLEALDRDEEMAKTATTSRSGFLIE